MLIPFCALFVASLLIFIFWPSRIQIQRVVDGDSLEAIYRGKPVRIRITGYDAPEYRQPGGREARAALADIVQSHSVRMLFPSRDRYGRLLGSCWAGKMPVAWRMIAAGHAWPASKAGFLVSLAPRISRKGLWAYRHRIHPSLWRNIDPTRHPADG